MYDNTIITQSITMNKAIILNSEEATLLDFALRKYWGQVKRELGGSGAGHPTLRVVETLLNKARNPESHLPSGLYEVTGGEIKHLPNHRAISVRPTRLVCDNKLEHMK